MGRERRLTYALRVPVLKIVNPRNYDYCMCVSPTAVQFTHSTFNFSSSDKSD